MTLEDLVNQWNSWADQVENAGRTYRPDEAIRTCADELSDWIRHHKGETV
jgi:hypothetical protein